MLEGSAAPKALSWMNGSLARGVFLVVMFALAGSVLHAQVAADADALPPGVDQEVLVTRDPDVQQFDNPVWSPDGRHLAVSDGRLNGVYVLDTVNGTCLQITDAPSSGYACHWSSDGGRLAFKLLIPSEAGDSFQQIPVIYDVQEGRLTALHPAVARAGVPSFAANGLIAFTLVRELRIADGEGRVVQAFGLDNYANLAPISPDGTQVAYNCENDGIWVLDLATGSRRILTKAGEGHFGPVWSPDSTKLVVSTLTGRLKAIEVSTGRVSELDEGATPSWGPDSDRVFYCRTERIDGVRVLRSDVYAIGWDGTGKVQLSSTASAGYIRSARVSPDGLSLACVGLVDGEVTRLALARGSAEEGAGVGAYSLAGVQPLADAALPITRWAGDLEYAAGVDIAEMVVGPQAPQAQVRVAGTVPYMHQVYDTPNWFNGHWACGATSAQMAINYYGTLPWWDCTVSSPYSHVSHWGRYVCETYSFNGYTYNIASADPNGTAATGGYGYIVRNNWADTKGYMRDYIIRHTLGSSVDWSPTWAELRTEVNNNNPFVLLNMLTSSGHYITTIGYFDNQHTAIFNDPYGNKNSGYMNYSGTGVYYDWPGYNNGYSNLNTAECFIYCRGSITSAPVITAHPGNQAVAPGATANFTVTATGTAPLSYRWQKGGVNMNNGGHYSGVTTATLTVSSCDGNDVAGYRCVVTNSVGSATSNTASLTLATGMIEFIVESRSGGKNYNRYGEAGTWSDSTGKSAAPEVTPGIGSRYAYISTADRNATFSYTAAATGTYEIYVTGPWSTNAPSSARHIVSHAGGSTDRYVDQNANTNAGYSTQWNSIGQYTLTSGVSYGVTLTTTGSTEAGGGTVLRADAVKWVLLNGAVPPPTISSHPSAQSTCPGGGASFAVGASGEGTLTYQWQKDGADLAESGQCQGVTTTTLNVSSCASADAGAYRCRVTNNGGAVTSNAAALTVRAATVVSQNPASQTVTQGETVQFAVAATGDGTLTYQWQKNGANLVNGGAYSGVTTATLTISDADLADVAGYCCVVTGGCGSATSAAAALTIDRPRVPADFDFDGDVDLDDFAGLQLRLGSIAPFSDPMCGLVDLSGNDWVESSDVVFFRRCMTGPEIPGDPDCTAP